MTPADLRKTMVLLFEDAKARGMADLAIVYGDAAIRLGWVIIADQIETLVGGKNGGQS